MKGLELSEHYYREIGRPMLEKEFPEYLPRIAAGLMGDGSDCLGFDDAISQDHDFGPGFCLWLDPEDFRIIGGRMQSAYEQLPGSFHGFSARNATPYGSDRVGVMDLHEFVRRYIGSEQPPGSLFRWLTLPEEKLAALTAGKIFEDNAGVFSRLQNALRYYPEDIRLKKIAASAMRMAQSGQYNYPRCLRRKDAVAAQFALDEFMKSAIQMIHLLNRRYTPYYKWMYRSLLELPVLKEVSGLIQQLTGPAPPKIQLIEEICRLVAGELERQELIRKTDTYLGIYPSEIIRKIQDEELKGLHILVG